MTILDWSLFCSMTSWQTGQRHQAPRSGRSPGRQQLRRCACARCPDVPLWHPVACACSTRGSCTLPAASTTASRRGRIPSCLGVPDSATSAAKTHSPVPADQLPIASQNTQDSSWPPPIIPQSDELLLCLGRASDQGLEFLGSRPMAAQPTPGQTSDYPTDLPRFTEGLQRGLDCWRSPLVLDGSSSSLQSSETIGQS